MPRSAPNIRITHLKTNPILPEEPPQDAECQQIQAVFILSQSITNKTAPIQQRKAPAKYNDRPLNQSRVLLIGRVIRSELDDL